MTNAPAGREQFEIVRRGYEPQQVDRRVAALANELEAANRRRAELERRVEELRIQPEQQGDQSTPYAGLGARLEQILVLAEEEAKELRNAAIDDATQHRALTEQDADKIRQDAERYAQERRTDADTEAARVLHDAKRQADKLRDESERDAKARREEAEALFEHNRANAAQAAADFETTLARRRDQAEHDFTEQMKASEAQIGAITARSEQLRLEAEKLRSDSDRKSKRTMDEAARQADDIIAEAKSTAAKIRSESERELSAATQRRDSINSQLTNVRQMLATLTGASLPDPIGEGAPPEDAAAAKKAIGKDDAAKPAGGQAAGDKPDAEKAAADKPAADKAAGAPVPQGKDAERSITPEKHAPQNR